MGNEQVTVVLVALVVSLMIVGVVVALARAIVMLSAQNGRLTSEALRMIQAKHYQDFAVGRRIEKETDRADRVVPRGPPEADEEAAQKYNEWEQAFDSPGSRIDEE
jgi:protein-disulfide isomerase-like protein with CxxC motif